MPIKLNKKVNKNMGLQIEKQRFYNQSQKMEAINSGVFDLSMIFFFVKKLFLGTVACGFFIGGVYFAYYLLNLYRLPKDSKQYRHQSQHLQKQNLIRYIITIACMILVSGLFYFGIEIGKESTHLGALVWIVVFLIVHLREKMKMGKKGVKSMQNKI